MAIKQTSLKKQTKSVPNSWNYLEEDPRLLPGSAPAQPVPPTPGGQAYLTWLEGELRSAASRSGSTNTAASGGTYAPYSAPTPGSQDYLTWTSDRIRESNPGIYLPHAGSRPGSGDYLAWVDQRIRESNPGKPLPSPGSRSPSGGSVFSEYKSGGLLPSQVSGYASVPGTSAAVPIPKPAQSRSDDDILKHDLDIYNSWPKEDQDALLWYQDNHPGSERYILNALNGNPFSLQDTAKALDYKAIVEKYGADTVANVAETVGRSRNREQADLIAAEAEAMAEVSGLLGFSMARMLNLAGPIVKPLGIIDSTRHSTGRYSTADPYNWGSRYGAYSQTLDRTNGDLMGQRLTNGAEFLSRMAQGAALPGSVDYTAPYTVYDSLEGTGAQRFIDGGGRLGYDVAANAADEIIMDMVTAGMGKKAAKMATDVLEVSNSFADNYTYYTLNGASPLEAVSWATVNGALEFVFGKLFDADENASSFKPQNAADVIRHVVQDSGKEMLGDALTDICSTLADVLMRQDESEFMGIVNQAKADGKSDAGAFLYAVGEECLDLLYNSAVNFFADSISDGAGKKLDQYAGFEGNDLDPYPIPTEADNMPPPNDLHREDPGEVLPPPLRDPGQEGHVPDLPREPGKEDPSTLLRDAVRPDSEAVGNAPDTQKETPESADGDYERYHDYLNSYMGQENGENIPKSAQTLQSPDKLPEPGASGIADPDMAEGTSPGEKTPESPQPARQSEITGQQQLEGLAEKIRVQPGITRGKAILAAQKLFGASERYGADREVMLAAYEPGQDPKRFASGFQNAYILGTLGEKAALSGSKAASYLTPGQREIAYEMGATSNAGSVTPGKGMKGKKGMVASADGRDDLENISIRAVTPIAQGFSAFPQNDILHERSKRIVPDGDKYDVAMHGSSQAVALGTAEANTSPRLLAQIIMHDKNYRGQDIRLLACNTGYSANGEYCFAEELANALGVTVWAPNDLIIIGKSGNIRIGRMGQGEMVPFMPNERRRIR